MFAVVTLCAVLDVVQHHHAGDEVDGFPGGQEVQVGPAVSPAVPVTGRRAKETFNVQFHSVNVPHHAKIIHSPTQPQYFLTTVAVFSFFFFSRSVNSLEMKKKIPPVLHALAVDGNLTLCIMHQRIFTF